MRFKNVKHAEYKLLQHLRNTGRIPLCVVLKRGVPGYVLGHELGIEQPLKKDDEVAFGRYMTAIKNLDGVLKNMITKRKKNVPKGDKKFIQSDSWHSEIHEFGINYEPEDDGYFWNGKTYEKIEDEEE